MTNECPVWINLSLLHELFPEKNKVTIWRYNTDAGGKKRLPAPDLVVGHVSLWSLPTILDWCESRNLTPDGDALARIVSAQS